MTEEIYTVAEVFAQAGEAGREALRQLCGAAEVTLEGKKLLSRFRTLEKELKKPRMRCCKHGGKRTQTCKQT